MATATEQTASLIRRTLAARWADLSEEAQEWALRTGRARTADVSVTLESAEEWRDDWRDDTGGSWPCYTLAVAVNGEPVGEVTGWHFVGPWRGYDASDWTERDDDGGQNGLPRYAVGDGRGPRGLSEGVPYVRGGDNMGDQFLPRFAEDGAALVYDADDVDAAISDAAGDADHGDAPSADDLDPKRDRVGYNVGYGRVGPHATYRIVRDWRVEEVEVYKLGKYSEGTDRDDAEYLVTGYAIDGDDTIYDTLRDAERAIEGDDGERYGEDDDAQATVNEMVDDHLRNVDDLPGMTHGRDADGLYVEPEDAEDDESRYHLDEEQTALVCRVGWLAVLDDVTEALGRRATLEAARSWQAEMDALIAERDPFVGFSDSVSAGNCRAGTASFREQLERRLGAEGEVGAARASVILAVRDDRYTRRACRMAAHRTLTARA